MTWRYRLGGHEACTREEVVALWTAKLSVVMEGVVKVVYHQIQRVAAKECQVLSPALVRFAAKLPTVVGSATKPPVKPLAVIGSSSARKPPVVVGSAAKISTLKFNGHVRSKPFF